ncbi:hypothetical protein D6D00_00364 [Aureobasidium pullulans]|uniref:Uncharacterized protein n=1 Tax=Aureobasidium pullulans TaxID=5580 RepID=A0A4S8SNT1_AURPU|nr:hypothetical protein D6D28_03867 [Aureobasidium pullulans]THY34208.1 hypothetical protein D6D00_00364 [Aureobasidium pullulans]
MLESSDSAKSSPHLRPNIEGSTRLAPEILMVIADHTSDEDLPNLRGTSAAFEYIVRPRLLERKHTDYYYPASNLGLERLIEIADQDDGSANIQNCIGVCEDDIESRKPYVGELSHWGHRIDGNLLHEAFQKVAVPMGARNFGIILIDDKNKRRRNEAAVQYGLKILELCDPSQFTVDVRYSKAMETDVQQSDDVKRVDATLGHRLLMLKDKCDHSCKFLTSHTLKCIDTHRILSLTKALTGENSLAEINFSRCEFPAPDSDTSLHSIIARQSKCLRRLTIQNASARSDWAREKLLDSIASCDHLEFCHLYNLTSSDDGAEEFKGEFEFKERDNIRSVLPNMKWTRRAEEV